MRGTMALLLLGHGAAKCDAPPQTVFEANPAAQATADADAKLFAGITAAVTLAPGQSHTFTYVVTWYFPNTSSRLATSTRALLRQPFQKRRRRGRLRRRAPRASQPAGPTSGTTPGSDSTLPHWFLERTFVNTSILATTTSLRYGTGRFWGWEGTGCCAGTCTHVWHYAQAVGRLFPEYERYVREHVDLGVALHPDGMIGYRGEGTGPATDGQCGRILGDLPRTPDEPRRRLPPARLAARQKSHPVPDGTTTRTATASSTARSPTPWTATGTAHPLDQLALRRRPARRRGDGHRDGRRDFADECRRKFLVSRAAIEEKLFNGEYFIQLPDPAHADAPRRLPGCDIDQVMGQAWAWQVGLGRVLDRDKTVSALKALYKYNFAPDVGRLQGQRTRTGRPYALAGDGGLIMVTNPQGLPNPFGRPRLAVRLLQRVHDRLRAPGRRPHDRRGPGAGGPGGHAGDPRPLPRRAGATRTTRSSAATTTRARWPATARSSRPAGSSTTARRATWGSRPRLTPEDFRPRSPPAEGGGRTRRRQRARSLTAEVTGASRAPAPGDVLGDAAAQGVRRTVTATLDGRPVGASCAPDGGGRTRVTFSAPLTLTVGETLQMHLAE